MSVQIVFSKDGGFIKEPTKVCSECGAELPLSSFYANSYSKDGHMGMCKECRRQVRKCYRHRQPTPAFFRRLEKLNCGLSFLSDQMLIDELKARGYSGAITYNQTVTQTVKF